MGPERMRLLKRGMKWYCSHFPFGSLCVFVKLCQITEPKLSALGAHWCVCVYVCISGKKKQAREERTTMLKCEMQKCLRKG